MLANVFSYLAYRARLRWREAVALLIDLGFLVSAGFAFRADLRQLALGLALPSGAGFLWGLVQYARKLPGLRALSETDARWVRAVPSPGAGVALAELWPSELEAASGFATLAFGEESAVRSAAFDAELQGRDWRVALSPAKRVQVRAAIEQHLAVTLPLLTRHLLDTRGRVFVNDAKLCLSCDLVPLAAEARCHLGGYYDSFLTNEAVTLVLEDRDSGRPVIDGTSLFPAYRDAGGRTRLQCISDARVNNHIGASTLGFTTDGMLVLWEQSGRAMQSRGLLVPTGSGSCDAGDLVPDSLKRSVEAAMERELREESLPREPALWVENGASVATPVGPTLVLGYFRWVRRAGKPEFVGISRINLHSGVLQPNTREVRRPTERRPCSFRARTVAELLESLQHIRAMHPRRSVSLELALLALEEYAARDAPALELFLRPAEPVPAGAGQGGAPATS